MTSSTTHTLKSWRNNLTAFFPKRSLLFSLVFGGFFSAVYFLGADLYTDHTLFNTMLSPSGILLKCLSVIGTALLFAVAFLFLLKLTSCIKSGSAPAFLSTDSTIRNMFLFAGILFVVWFPVYLAFCPGVISYDIAYQLPQALGEASYSNHQPIFHTWILALFLKIDNLIPIKNIGFMLFILFQMFSLACACGYMLESIRQVTLGKWYTIMGLLFLAFFPTIALFSTLPTKDTLFSASLLFFCTLVFRILIIKQLSKKYMILLIVASFLCSVLRNNGIYVVVLTLLCLLLQLKARIRVLYVLGSVIVLHLFMSVLYFPILGYQNSPSQEKLSVPISQLSAVYVLSPEKLSETCKQEIIDFIPDAELYNPRLADDTKTTFNQNLYASESLKFWILWGKVGLENPKRYIESFLTLNIPFWYPNSELIDPEAKRKYIELTWSEESLAYNTDYQVVRRNCFPFLREKLISFAKTDCFFMTWPIFRWFFTLSMPFWIILTQLFISLYAKKKAALAIYAPPLFLLLTYLAGPVSNLRYIVPLLCFLPLGMAFALNRFPQDKSINHE